MKSVAKLLDAGYRHRPHEMFGWFLSEIFHLWGLPRWQSEPPEDAKQAIHDAIGAYSQAIERNEPFIDLLGPLYMGIGSRGAKQMMGQFFTPWNMARVMASMIHGEGTEPEGGGLITACDPSCGSGVMMLALANYIVTQHGPDELKRYSFAGIDIDRICSHMMAVQFVANCATHQIHVGEIAVYNGDAIFPQKGMSLIIHATTPGVEPAPISHQDRIGMIRRRGQAGSRASNTEVSPA